MAVSDNASSQQQAWLDLQQQYWTIWQHLMRHILQPATTTASTSRKPDAPATTPNPNDWWENFSADVCATETAQQTIQHFIKQSKNYLAFSEVFMETIEKLPNFDTESANWHHLWEEGIALWESKLTEWLPEAINPASIWALPLDNWLRTASSFSTLPGDFLQNIKYDLNEKARETKQSKASPTLEELMTMLGLGYTGKWQVQYQEGARRWKNYQAAQQAYSEQFHELIVQALTQMREKVFYSSSQEPITDLRTLYDLWIESSEMTYVELVNSDAYAEKNANLINSLMAWKQHQQRMVDEVLCALHMPTRREFNSLGQRLHALRRETRALPISEVQEPVQLDELRQELNALRVEVAALKNTRARRSTSSKSAAKNKETPSASSETPPRKTRRTRKAAPKVEIDATSATAPSSVKPLKPTED